MDQEEICRVCRCEGSTEQPLFHPCKCSGSIKYVHQECLMIWLAHSRRSYCELCDHRYSFSPVYHMDMPDAIPIRLFIQQLAKKLFNLVCMTLRGCLVACMWLLVLPYFTLTVWRFYFWTGELLGEQLRRLQHYSTAANQLYAASNENYVPTTTTATTATVTASFISAVASHTLENNSLSNQSTTNATVTTEYTLLGQTFQVSTIKTLLAECIEGQVITFIVVVVFISIFHLREWIVQNIPEELLEDVGDDPIAIAAAAADDDDRQDDRPEQEHPLHDNQQPPLEPVFEHQDEENENLPNAIQQEAHMQEYDNTTNGDASGLQHQFNFGYQDAAAEIMHYETRRWDRRATSEPPYSAQKQQRLDDNDNDDPMMVDTNPRYRATSAEPVLNPYHSSLYLAAASSSSSGLHGRTIETDSFTNLPASASSSSSNWQPPHDHDDNGHNQIHILEHHRRHRPRLGVPTPTLQPVRQETPPPPPPPPPQLQMQLPPPPPQLREPPPQDFLMNDADGNADDDILDILDAIGIQGSLWTLVQNIAIIGMVISSSIAVTIWLPYLIGMTFVMADIFEVVWVPLLFTRMLTDPIIDWLVTRFMDITWPATTANLTSWSSTTFNYYTSTAPILIQNTLTSMTTKFTGLLSLPTAMISNGTIDSTSSLQHISDDVSWLSLGSIFDTLLQWWTHQAEPMVMNIVAWYQHLAVGTSVMDRAICIVIGYILALGMSSCYVSQALARMMFGDRAQGTLRQQYLILKVGLFLAIELFVFPTVCGLLLDFSTLPLLDYSSSTWRRLDHMRSSTLASMLVYWFVGSGFMLMFAWIITSCRAILRPGVLWFISDHNDPEFHPIKEIVQRPVWNHVEKLAISAVMYATIIVIGVGGSVQSIYYFGNNYLPLQWNLSRPISVIPFDLMVIQIVVPAVIHYFQPMQTVKKVYVIWMRFLCRHLRLTSFMFGIRTMDEEGAMRFDTWTGWFSGIVLQQYDQVGDGTLMWDGQLVRAPKRDGVKYIPGRRMLVPVDRTTLLPLDEREQQLGHPAAFQGAGGEEANTVIVYMPPRSKQRVALLVMMLWIFGSLVITSMTIIPLALGRYILKEGFSVEEPVPDMSSYLAGSAAMLMIEALIAHSAAVISDVVSHSNTSDRLHILGRHVIDMSHWIGKCMFFIVSFNVVLPLLIGLVMEMHFIFPFQDFGDQLPVFDVEPIWIRGFGLMNVIHGLLLALPANIFQANLTRAFRSGITNMDLRFFSFRILAPSYLICLFLLFMPFGFGLLTGLYLVNDDTAHQIKNMQLAYPVCLGALLVFSLTNLGVYMSDRWVEAIRENHFLVGRTLHNMDE